jgi:hypothetical protein
MAERWTSTYEDLAENQRLAGPLLWPPGKTTYGLDVSGLTDGDIYELVYVSMAFDSSSNNIIQYISDVSSGTLLTYYRILDGSENHHCFVDKYGLQIIGPVPYDLSSKGLSAKTVIVKDIRSGTEHLPAVQAEIKKLIKREIYHNITQTYHINRERVLYVPTLRT